MTHTKARSALLHALFVSVPLLATSCATVGSPSAEDNNPELVKRTGPRAIVMVAENAFAMRTGGSAGSGGITVTGPEGTQTITWAVHGSSFGWDQSKGHDLEVFFRTALNESGAFYVANRTTVEDVVADRDLEARGLQEAREDQSLLKRPDIKLVCTLTKLDDNAERREDDATVAGWQDHVPFGKFFGGSGRRSTQRGECEVMVEIVDRATGLTVTSAKGAGYSIGTSEKARAGGWQRAIFAGVGTSKTKGVDMSAAIQRATIRAVNDLIGKIPANYYRHELTLGAPAAAVAVAPAATGR